MEHLSNDHKDRFNQHENSNKLSNKTGHPVMSLTKKTMKTEIGFDQNYPMEGNPLQNKYYHPKKERNLKEQDYECHRQRSEWKSQPSE